MSLLNWLIDAGLNWLTIVLLGILGLMELRLIRRDWYYRLFNSIPLKSWLLPVAVVGFAGIMWRETLITPFWAVQSWMPGSYVWEVLVLWMATTHMLSFLTYGALIFFLWRKFNSFVPALYVGWLAIGAVEFTFILQHWLHLGIFMGFEWYAPFFVMMLPVLVEIQGYTFSKKSIPVLIAALFLQYLLLLWYPYSLTTYNYDLGMYRLNPSILPHPPLATWLFVYLNHGMKVVFVAVFAFIGVKHHEESVA